MKQNIERIHTTKYWHQLDDGRIQCDICPRYCKLKPGQQGLCFIRENQNNQVVLTSYGYSSGFCIDPIEKKPLNHFYPGTSVLSFGTAGCNLACRFCQNWDISKSREIDTLSQHAAPEDIAKAAQQSGCRSVAYTYNDPIIFLEYAIDTAIACRERNIKSVAVSSGYICKQPREEFFQYVDAVNIDLKAFTDRFYWKLTGGHLQAVLDSLLYLKKETSVWLEITTLLIPGENDSQAELENLTSWIFENLGADVPLHFTAFHPSWKMMNKPATSPATLKLAREIALRVGLHYAYTGNIYDPASQSTYCHHCGQILIGRNGYELSNWNLKEGKCNRCEEMCAGHFEQNPGQWGSRRSVVNIPQV
ncbi:MAG: AmmeMemoRadiSam system radical SAM enzyme [Gammaproteobacteria bacterium]|nr:AmmeMemoRadiSam system radical SAM enzyme [Gammaproteobacteria bacterium]